MCVAATARMYVPAKHTGYRNSCFAIEFRTASNRLTGTLRCIVASALPYGQRPMFQKDSVACLAIY